MVRGLAQRQVEPDLVGGDLQALAEGGDAARQQRGRVGQRQADVGGADDLAGQRAERLPDLLADHHAAHLLEHAHERPGHLLGLRRQP